MKTTRLISIALITVMVLTVVSGGGVMTAAPAKAYDTPTKVGDLVYLPESYYPTAVDVGDVYVWGLDYIHIKYVIAENPAHPWSSAGIQSASLQAAWTYVATAANGEGIPHLGNGELEKMFFVPPYGDSQTQLNHASEYEVVIPQPSGIVDICGKLAVWVTYANGQQFSIGVWACTDTGSEFNYVRPYSDADIVYLTYSVSEGALSPPPNQPPTANAGPDQTAIVRNTVTLDGSASSDPDGNQLTYTWTIISKPSYSTATLTNPTSVYPTLIPDRMGTYVIQLVVNDSKVDSAPDTVTITTKPGDGYWPGRSSVYLFDVTSTSDPHGWGRLLINLNEQQFVFFGLGFQPGEKYLLTYSQASTGGEPVPVADAAANEFGVIYTKGEWTQAIDPSTAEFTINVIAQAGLGPLDAILTVTPGPQGIDQGGAPGQWFYFKANASTGDIVRYRLQILLDAPDGSGGVEGDLYDGPDPNLGGGAQGYGYLLPDVRTDIYTMRLTVYDSAGASDMASIVWNPTV